MTITISAENPDSPDSLQLIAELDEHLMEKPYPQESRHAFDVQTLIRQKVAFFVARHNGEPAGCGGVKLFEEYGEVKRMFVRPRFRGLGLGKHMLQHLSGYSLERGIKILRLETGIHQTEAIGLYEGFGFRRIPPFGEYREDPMSVYLEKQL